MEKTVSLKEVERRAYRSTFEDGFYDLACGGLFWLLALIQVFESAGISRFICYPFILLLAIIPWLGKRYVTIPRLGAVEFGEKRKARKRYTALIGLGVIVVMLPLVVMMFAKGFPQNMTWQTVALVAAPVIAIGVFLLDYSRMYIYAALLLFSIVASESLRVYFPMPLPGLVAFGVPGAAIIGYGFSLLLSFLKKYPRPAAEVTDVSR